MDESLKDVLEKITIGAVFLLIYWFIGLIIYKLYKKEIRSDLGYAKCIIAGFILETFFPNLLNY